MAELVRSEYFIERKIWAKILKKNLMVELLEAFEKSDRRFIFDLGNFCEEHGVNLSEVNRREIKKVEEKLAVSKGKGLKLRILK
jgi:hypothetical protein